MWQKTTNPTIELHNDKYCIRLGYRSCNGAKLKYIRSTSSGFAPGFDSVYEAENHINIFRNWVEGGRSMKKLDEIKRKRNKSSGETPPSKRIQNTKKHHTQGRNLFSINAVRGS